MDMAAQGTREAVTVMLQDAIMAVQAASASGQETTGKIAGQANHPELKALLEHGSSYAATWRERLAQLARKVGAPEQAASMGNPIIDAIQKAGGLIIHKASDATARDLGVIASGQLALHYYIAAFGTMAAYAKMLGMPEVAEVLAKCLAEARQGDERYTELAAKIGG